MRERIAVLVAQVDETTQHRFLTAFIKEAYAHDYDLCIFTMYQKYQETWLRNIGDSNIFHLVDFNMFSAVLIMLDTIQTPGLSEPLQKRVKREFKGPVLVVDRTSPFFDSVMMDHYTPFRKLVDHLIEVHGYHDIAFLGGKEGHPHSVQRYQGYLDSMKSHGLPVNKEWIFHGNYWYDSAEEFVDKLLLDREHLPRALACANDCMAIGAAARFAENKISVPDDIAIIGYDSLPEGKDSPEPLTSADIPADECGVYCLLWLDAKIQNKEVPQFQTQAPLFIGSSCGCPYKVEMVPKKLRAVWRTRQSSRGVFSDFNHILEDLLSHSDMQTFLGTIKDYSYQIQPFYTFDLCFNEGFWDPECTVGKKAIRKGYAKRIYHVLGIGEGRKGISEIELSRSFDRKRLLPFFQSKEDAAGLKSGKGFLTIGDELPYPTTYIFNPLYFEDRCFGYTVLNHGEDIALYDRGYRIWMRNIMQGLEAFYRQQFMQSLVERIQSDQVRDSLTGLYNYTGFIEQVGQLAESVLRRRQTAAMEHSSDYSEKSVYILAIDMKGLKTANEMYGRQFGDRCIKSLARVLSLILHDDEIGARMCNDEFLIALTDQVNGVRCKEITDKLHAILATNPMTTDSEYLLDFYCASATDEVLESSALESLINRAINIKNHMKRKQIQTAVEAVNVENEIKQNQIVERILNLNHLTYFYQPIVSTTDGSIFAYEALMRDVDGVVSPLQIIRSAIYLKRLDDVEKATLLNVTEDVQLHSTKFTGKKVFINSIPGTNISEADDTIIMERMHSDEGRYVVEFTEENEMDDERLARLELKFQRIGAEIAIDDFGVGYSNVSNLLRYMPQYVKIDRQLVSNIQNNPQKQHFVKSIIDFSHENHIKVLAEGVENQEELKESIYLGVDLIQGYYTGRPQREVVSEINSEIMNEIKRLKHMNNEWQSKFI